MSQLCAVLAECDVVNPDIIDVAAAVVTGRRTALLPILLGVHLLT